MLFIRKEQVDKDVEKLRQSMMSPEQLKREQTRKEAEIKKHQEAVSEFTWKDVLAMSIAIFEILLPYMLVFAGVMALVFLFFLWMAHS